MQKVIALFILFHLQLSACYYELSIVLINFFIIQKIEKDLLPLNNTINKLGEIAYQNYIMKMEGNKKLKEIDIKNCASYYFDYIIKIEDFNFGNNSMDQKSYENILVYNISDKTLIGTKNCSVLDQIKQKNLLEFMM